MLSQPLLYGSASHKGSSSTCQASLTLFKAVVGTGIFALPPAIRAVGWLAGSAVVLLIAALSGYTMCLIVGSVQELRHRGVPGHSIEYQDMVVAAFPQLNAPITFLCMMVNYGGIVGFYDFVVANVSIRPPHTRTQAHRHVATQPHCALCRATAHALSAGVQRLSLLHRRSLLLHDLRHTCVLQVRTLSPALERWHVLLAVFLIDGPLSLLRSTAHPLFRISMLFGNLAIALACGAVLYFGLTAETPTPLSELSAVDGSGLGLALGVCLYMFTAHMEVCEQEDHEARHADSLVTTSIPPPLPGGLHRAGHARAPPLLRNGAPKRLYNASHQCTSLCLIVIMLRIHLSCPLPLIDTHLNTPL